MAQGDIPITIIGNLTKDPELRYTKAGKPVASFTIASTPQKYDSRSGGWVGGDPIFMRCSAWGTLGENLAQSCAKGMRIIATGVLKQRQYETREGEKRTVMELEVTDAGPSLKWASAQVAGNPRGGNPASTQPHSAGGVWDLQDTSQPPF